MKLRCGTLKLDLHQIEAVDVHVGYWRKANAIHGWFVENVAKGVDDCRSMRVDPEELVELSDLCQRILDMPEGEERDKLIMEKLPPTDGFFFGSTKIDEDYFQDLKDTVKILENVSEKDWKDPFFDGYFYHASW